MNFWRGNPVLLVLAALGWLGALAAGFVAIAPNRLMSGRPVALGAATDSVTLAAMIAAGLALAAAALLPGRRVLHRAVALIGAALALLACHAAGHAAERLMSAAMPAARVSLGLGFWLVIASAMLAIVDAAQKGQAGPATRLGLALGLCSAIAAMAAVGQFDHLSIMVEYRAHRATFAHELARHGLLVLGSVGAALVIGIPLGLALVARSRLRAPVFTTLSLLQTIPSMALFGLLIAPLSFLSDRLPALKQIGIQGIGVTPALIALTCYALLPIVRHTYAGIIGVNEAVIEAARGMGMTRRQILWRIETPLAAPVLLAGLRITLVQSIGMAVVAALIGAGGLGTFVFQGIGQYAVDLVLLGSLPAIFLALAADFILKTLPSLFQQRGLS